MANLRQHPSIPDDSIQSKIHFIRGQKVMLDRDLARLYQVETRSINQAVKRNIERFPEDFMFKLTPDEISRSQIVILKHGHNIKYSPYAFTEQGVAMLSSVLNSRMAIQVNIHIIRTFVRMRAWAETHRDLWLKIDGLEKKYDSQFQVVFKAIKLLLDKDPGGPKRRF